MITPEFENKLLGLVEQYPTAVLKAWAIEWDRHIQNNFKTAGNGEWKKKYIDDGRAILTGKTGLLKGTTTVEPDFNTMTLTAGNSVSYGEINQTGGKLPVTEKMRKYFWKQFKETKNEKWKRLALMKKNYIIIPARPYITITDNLLNNFFKAAEYLLNKYS